MPRRKQRVRQLTGSPAGRSWNGLKYTYNYFPSYGLHIKCDDCGEGIPEGDPVKYHRKKRKKYHRNCN